MPDRAVQAGRLPDLGDPGGPSIFEPSLPSVVCHAAEPRGALVVGESVDAEIASPEGMDVHSSFFRVAGPPTPATAQRCALLLEGT